MTPRQAMVRVLVIGALFLVALWAFAAYLQPAFSGERGDGLLYCF